MKFYKFISTILHPIVIPTISAILYFLVIPNVYASAYKIAVLGLVFVVTYLIPILILIIFKKLRFIHSYQAENIQERKIPIAIMIVLFYLLGYAFYMHLYIRDLGLLFVATSAGLLVSYLLFFLKLKTSIHLLSVGLTTGFFIVIGMIYGQPYTAVIIICLLLSGILASARLHLRAHTPKEVYIGFFIGLISPLVVYYIL